MADLNSEEASPLDAITMRNQRESPLLRLSTEIRNNIYEYALGGYRVWVPYKMPFIRLSKLDHDEPDDEGEPFYKPRPALHWLALTEVCRQVHSETALMPFRLNIFSAGREWHFAEEPNLLFSLLLDYLSDAQRDAIEVIELSYNAMKFLVPTDKLRGRSLRLFTDGSKKLRGLRRVILLHQWHLSQGRSSFSPDGFRKAIEGVESFLDTLGLQVDDENDGRVRA